MRTPANLMSKLERMLAAYATAASAAGVGILSLAGSANAKVVYTPAHVQITLGTPYNLDLNGDGVTDFAITAYYGGLSDDFFYTLGVTPLNGAVGGYLSRTGGFELASALVPGVSIDSRRRFQSRFSALLGGVFYFLGSTFTKGPWVNVKNRYLGFKFIIHRQTHFGWARLSVHCDTNRPFHVTGVLTGYAYETIANQGIIAGNRGSTTGQGPEAEAVSLGRLALGASATRLRKAAN